MVIEAIYLHPLFQQCGSSPRSLKLPYDFKISISVHVCECMCAMYAYVLCMQVLMEDEKGQQTPGAGAEN